MKETNRNKRISANKTPGNMLSFKKLQWWHRYLNWYLELQFDRVVYLLTTENVSNVCMKAHFQVLNLNRIHQVMLLKARVSPRKYKGL